MRAPDFWKYAPSPHWKNREKFEANLQVYSGKYIKSFRQRDKAAQKK